MICLGGENVPQGKGSGGSLPETLSDENVLRFYDGSTCANEATESYDLKCQSQVRFSFEGGGKFRRQQKKIKSVEPAAGNWWPEKGRRILLPK